MAKFRKIEIFIDKRGYGNYRLNAMYRRKDIKVHITDSECYDWLNDDSNKIKHLEAKRYAYNKIREAYNHSK